MNIIKLLYIVMIMNKLYFSNEVYRKNALSISSNDMNVHNYNDAFFQLINGLDYESLSVLCDNIYDEFVSLLGNSNITKNDCYLMTQNLNLSVEFKEFIVEKAIECIKNGMYLGTKVVSNHNTSAWINHSYYVGECSSNLAWMLDLDSDVARTYGLMHDYGRKKEKGFNHVIYGYQELYDLDYKTESIACLTHSFLNGERCANNEKAIDGFYVDSYGNAKWMENSEFDDIKLFLDNYQYNDYDMILNVSDLMATEKGVLSPYDRICDIAKRREIDLTNRGYFLSEFTNTLINLLKRMDLIDKNTDYIKCGEDVELSYIEDRFKQISKYFYVIYIQLMKERNKKK